MKQFAGISFLCYFLLYAVEHSCFSQYTLTQLAGSFVYGSAGITVEETGANVYIVNTTADDPFNAPAGSLRRAIEQANSTSLSARNIIKFEIPGSSPHTIFITAELPALERNIIINGAPIPGQPPSIIIDGSMMNCDIWNFGLLIGGNDPDFSVVIQGIAIKNINAITLGFGNCNNIISRMILFTIPHLLLIGLCPEMRNIISLPSNTLQ